MRKYLFLAALVLVAAAATAAAISTRKSAVGALDGIVLNAKGAPVPSAQVFRQDADGTAPHAMHADANGHFHMAPLPAGLYELRAQAGGMWSDWAHNILVRPGANANVTLRLVRMRPPSSNKPKN